MSRTQASSRSVGMKFFRAIPLVFFFLLALNAVALSGYLEDTAADFKPFWIEKTPDKPVEKWLVPFEAKDRTSFKAIKIISTFGAPRESYVKGHIHTAIDCIPSEKQRGETIAYPIADGVVVSIHLDDPHRTVVVRHKLPDGSSIYSSYKHLQDARVNLGQSVTPTTALGRLYTRAEAKKLGGNYDHLHLEIRKKIDDYGVGSWATMTKEELNSRFYDPLVFLKNNLGTARSQ